MSGLAFTGEDALTVENPRRESIILTEDEKILVRFFPIEGGINLSSLCMKVLKEKGWSQRRYNQVLTGLVSKGYLIINEQRLETRRIPQETIQVLKHLLDYIGLQYTQEIEKEIAGRMDVHPARVGGNYVTLRDHGYIYLEDSKIYMTFKGISEVYRES